MSTNYEFFGQPELDKKVSMEKNFVYYVSMDWRLELGSTMRNLKTESRCEGGTMIMVCS